MPDGGGLNFEELLKLLNEQSITEEDVIKKIADDIKSEPLTEATQGYINAQKKQDESESIFHKINFSIDKFNKKGEKPVTFDIDEYAEITEDEIKKGSVSQAEIDAYAFKDALTNDALAAIQSANDETDDSIEGLLSELHKKIVDLGVPTTVPAEPKCFKCSAPLLVEGGQPLLPHQMTCKNHECISVVEGLHWSPSAKAAINPGFATAKETLAEIKPTLPAEIRPNKRVIDY